MKRIMIVDDLEQNRYLLERLLQGNDYEINTFANGAEALAAAQKVPPDLIISDILMPVMDGFALCREWMKNAGLRKIPFVFYTATYTDQKDEEFALSLGAARFVVKPQETGVFLGIIRVVLTEYEKGRVNAKPSPEPEEKIFLKEYNEALVRKLEDKLTQVEISEKELRRVNADLEKDIEMRKQAEQEVNRQVRELKHWHSISLAREDRIMELKKEVNEILARQGQPPKYAG